MRSFTIAAAAISIIACGASDRAHAIMPATPASLAPAVAALDGVGPVEIRYYHRYYGHHFFRGGCPDGISCFPLYGAYGPWGGHAYWSSFSYRW
jgi:hypothetical protein